MKLLKYHVKFTVLPADGDPWEEEISLMAVNIITAATAAQSALSVRQRPCHIHTINEDTP
jgi:hypothetical protein